MIMAIYLLHVPARDHHSKNSLGIASAIADAVSEAAARTAVNAALPGGAKCDSWDAVVLDADGALDVPGPLLFDGFPLSYVHSKGE